MSKDDLLSLPVEERLALISLLWDSLVPFLPMSPAQREELDRRLARLDEDLGDALPWADVRAKLNPSGD